MTEKSPEAGCVSPKGSEWANPLIVGSYITNCGDTPQDLAKNMVKNNLLGNKTANNIDNRLNSIN